MKQLTKWDNILIKFVYPVYIPISISAGFILSKAIINVFEKHDLSGLFFLIGFVPLEILALWSIKSNHKRQMIYIDRILGRT